MGRFTRLASFFLFTLIITLILSLYAACGNLFSGRDEGAEITRLVIREKSGTTSLDYPLSFGHVFKRGDVPSGYSVSVSSGAATLPSQFDIKSRYPDGSVRHGVISVRIPSLFASTDMTLSLARSRAANGPGLDKNAILATDIGATLELLGLDLTADLREAIEQSAQLDYWLRGDICTEIIVRQELNSQLNALWEVRFYPTSIRSDTAEGDLAEGDTPYIRISHTIENVNLSTRGNVNYALRIKQGNANPAEVYSKANFQHNQSSRWRKVLWLGEEPPEVEIRYNLPYMISTGMILPYDTSLQINESAINTFYNAWRNSNRDIMGNGTIERSMPATGGRPDIGMLPKWTAMYLLSMDNRMREVMLNNGEMSGSAPIHYREDNSALKFHGKIVSIDDRINFNLITYNGPPSIGATSTNWHPDLAHQPSLAYIPYLITGERWFLDELYYWAGYNLIFALYHRDTRGDIPGANGSFGLIGTELRGIAWGLRTVSDAAAIGYDGDIEKSYFKSKLINNLIWFVWRNEPPRGHGVNATLWPGTGHTSSNWPGWQISPWMHDFMVLSAAHIARQHADIPNAAVFRDLIGKFTINRFTMLPTYAGVAYRMPLHDLVGSNYRNGGWTQYAADLLVFTNNANPETYFRTQNYGYSYAFIAMGASAVVSHLNGGLGVYNFIRNNVSYEKEARDDPTWAFVPLR